jgi:hypothetical protein
VSLLAQQFKVGLLTTAAEQIGEFSIESGSGFGVANIRRGLPFAVTIAVDLFEFVGIDDIDIVSDVASIALGELLDLDVIDR